MHKSKVVNNTIMLYIMNIAKLIFPLLTLPYLTRVLTEDTYGMVSFVKSCMIYMQLIIDFGFIFSSVKDIVNAGDDKKKIGIITGNTIFAKFLLCIVSALILLVMCCVMPILKISILFTIMSFLGVATSIFVADFLFRGIEKMQFISLTYLITKTITTTCTFVFVKNDESILWIPVLDILAHMISFAIALGVVSKLKISIRLGAIKDCLLMIKDSFLYFLSSMATTAFSALNTLLIGIYITDLTQIAYWSLCLSIVATIQGLYAPICNSAYPHMIRERSLKFIHKVLLIFMPVVTIGCVACFFLAKTALFIVGGEKYIEAYTLFRWMIPILFFSFPAQIYGWPTLGAIGKVKATTTSTIIAAVAQVMGLIILILFNQLTLINMAILRFSTEALMMLIRMLITYRNKKEFVAC